MRRYLLLLLLSVATLALPAQAAPSAAEYVRARAAEFAGDHAQASAAFASLLAREPDNKVLAGRAMRQAVLGGDEKLAVRAARALDVTGALPADGRLLLAVAAIGAGEWTNATAQVTRLDSEGPFRMLVPMLRAWIAVGSKTGDPLSYLQPGQGAAGTQALAAEQRAFILLAMGRTEEGIAAIRGLDSRGIAARPLRLRLIAADALVRAGQKERALGLLDGPQPALVLARKRVETGAGLGTSVTSPGAGVAALLVGLAAGLDRNQMASIGFALSRYATFVAPRDTGAWAMAASYAAAIKQQEAGLAAVANIPPDDPMAPAARTLKVALLNDLGRREEALAEAMRDVKDGEPGVASWSRLGDVNMALERHADAAAAYGKAIAAAEADALPRDAVWPLWLQHGSALELAGDWPKAKAALRKALELAPDQAVVLNQLGYSQVVHRDDVPAATRMIERASMLRPDDAAITDSLGWVRYLAGDVAGAIPLLEKAAAGDPAEPTINEHLGDAYWQAGRRIEARHAWRAALVSAADKDKVRLTAKIDDGLSDATASP